MWSRGIDSESKIFQPHIYKCPTSYIQMSIPVQSTLLAQIQSKIFEKKLCLADFILDQVVSQPILSQPPQGQHKYCAMCCDLPCRTVIACSDLTHCQYRHSFSSSLVLQGAGCFQPLPAFHLKADAQHFARASSIESYL